MERKKIILAITGKPGAGKGTAVEIIKKELKNKKVETIRFSDSLTEALGIFLPSEKIGRADYQWFAPSMRERFGGDFLAKAVEKKLKSLDYEVAVLDGVRVAGDEEMIRRNEGFLIFVDAPLEVRWSRSNQRKEKSDDLVSLEKFRELDKGQTELEIEAIGARADFKITNLGSLEDFKAEIAKVLKMIFKD